MQIIIWVDNFRQCRKVSVCKYEPKTGQANFWELIESKYKRFLLGKIIHDTELMRKKTTNDNRPATWTLESNSLYV